MQAEDQVGTPAAAGAFGRRSENCLPDLVARPHPDVTYFPSPRLTDLRRPTVFADAKQTTWRLERPFVLPAGIVCAPTTIPAVPGVVYG